MFKYYILKYNTNIQKIEHFNIFQNSRIEERTEQEVKKYVRSPKKYTYKDYWTGEEIYGFDAFCKKLDLIIKGELWSRRQYEISVGDAFETDCSKLEKWDGYGQCEKNIPTIAREVIWQYKQQRKAKNEKNVI